MNATLPKELQKLEDEFLAMKIEAGDFLAKVNDNKFNKRPEGNGWSIAECIDHLIVTGDDYCNQIENGLKILEEKKLAYSGEMKNGWFAAKFISNVEPPVKRKFKAPQKWRPATSINKAKATAAYLQLQDRWIDLLHKSAAWDLTKVRIPSPAVSWIKFSAFAAFGINSAHQRRHFEQAKNVKKNL